MRKEYDFSQAKRANQVPHLVALQSQENEIKLDEDVLAQFRATGQGWQTRINDALKEWLAEHSNQIKHEQLAI
ncbi:MAG: BrnA antitoxin family protein [Methylococcaceae bacterium]|jgi:uncharacterized protein (DUF4415 family)